MKTTTLNFSNLLPACNQLEASLFYWRYSAPGIWPADDMEDEDLKAFVVDLYTLAHTCLCLRMPIIAPDCKPYVYDGTPWLGKVELIILTRQLLFCCDMDLIYEYRQPDLPEYEAVRLLEQIHAQLIGAVYGQHPFMDTLEADQFRFLPGA